MALAVSVLTTGLVSLGSAAPAAADGCYTWSGTLREGSTGEAVRQLQIRVAGWVGQDEVLSVDGEYGARTAAAVKRFQAGYGLGADGVAGPQTFNKIYELQDNDCTPIHFTYAELDKCGDNYTGSSKASQATAKARTLQVMWQLEALRRKLGDDPLRVTSGFRNDACNARAGGAADSPHLYGLSGDLGSGPHSLCTIYRAARSAGFSGLLGPGYPGHDDHVHADNRHVIGRAAFRSASSC
ncbi:D-Ala-D-Ala carboxypeptidase family metallohydrolase [Micromonospora sp. NPDC049679]|uniref:D-Ala-D-Ala carboxypeptidase family metallohydrolase n=1 Tax=Micromonospora sp. NPDC049679 TaxID=3155920 RepID=UPI00340F0EA3